MIYTEKVSGPILSVGSKYKFAKCPHCDVWTKYQKKDLKKAWRFKDKYGCDDGPGAIWREHMIVECANCEEEIDLYYVAELFEGIKKMESINKEV